LIIGIDVESGERSFKEYVKGAITSIKLHENICISLIGNTEKIINSFPDITENKRISLVDSNEIIFMDEEPIKALKKKKNSTIAIGINLLKENKIDVFYSPGNTGAIVCAAIFKLGMIEGVKRPSMATYFPRIEGGETLITDIGSNPDASEINLLHNAVLGMSYYKLIWKKENPTVGLLNMGGESIKGTSILKKAYNLLKTIPSFIGNVEGYNVFNGSVDVVVCNGLTGNSILKIAEASKKYFISMIEKKFLSDNYNNHEYKKIITKKLLPVYFGAAPLLGVNGIVLIGHGASSIEDLLNAITLAIKLNSINFINELNDNVKKLLKKD